MYTPRFLTAAAAAAGVLIVISACSRPAPPPPPGPRVYVSDETGTEVVVVDPVAGRVIQKIAMGRRPRGIKLSPDASQLFVALSGSPIGGPGVDESKLPPADRSADGIGVLDLATGQLGRKLKSGQDPESFDLSVDEATLFVSNEDAAEMSVVDVRSGDVRSHLKVGEEPEGVTLRPGGTEVYITCESDAEVFAIDVATGHVAAKIKVGQRPRAIAFTR